MYFVFNYDCFYYTYVYYRTTFLFLLVDIIRFGEIRLKNLSLTICDRDRSFVSDRFGFHTNIG